MKKIFLLICILGGLVNGLNAQTDSLVVNYYENFPYAYSESGTLKGIEIDILREYTRWLKQKKNITVNVSYRPYREFSAFYNSVKNGSKNTIGLGSVTSTTERQKEVSFSAPYLRNVAVMVTAGSVPTMKSREPAVVKPVLEKLSGVVVKQSSHTVYIDQLKKNYVPALKVSYTETQDNVLDRVVSDPTVFGYVDVVAYWSYLKSHPDKFLKMQKAFREPTDYMSFIMPGNAAHAQLVNEFLESGFGFTATKAYRQILEKYLGHEIIDSVEMK